MTEEKHYRKLFDESRKLNADLEKQIAALQTRIEGLHKTLIANLQRKSNIIYPKQKRIETKPLPEHEPNPLTDKPVTPLEDWVNKKP